MPLLFRQLSNADLIDLCRALRYSLSGGMMVTDAVNLLAREGTPRVRRTMSALIQDLKQGWSLHEAMEKQGNMFPPLFRALVAVGEETGNLPEVMGELEKYYITQLKLRRDFISDITWPVIQFVIAVLVVTGLIGVMGVIQDSVGTSGNEIDPLGLGLLGIDGALKFLGGVLFVLFVGFLLVRFVSFIAVRVPRVQRMIFHIPILGTCLRALALTRLCIALRLMLDTRMSVLKAIRLSFAATDNAAYVAAAPQVEGAIRRGNTIADSFGQTAVIPDPFRSAVAVAEESGRLPEMCAVQAENYDEQARRQLATLNKIASILIWLVVAAFIITAIFRIFNTVYIKSIEKYIDKEGNPTIKEEPPPRPPRNTPNEAPPPKAPPRNTPKDETPPKVPRNTPKEATPPKVPQK
jgi:type IV pilus assembly protein PilC